MDDEVIKTEIQTSFRQQVDDDDEIVLKKTIYQIQQLIYRCFDKDYNNRLTVDELINNVVAYRDNLIGILIHQLYFFFFLIRDQTYFFFQ